MKIIQIIPNLKKGGAERLVLDICKKIMQYEHIVIKLIVFSNENEYSFLMNGIDVEVIPSTVKLSIVGKNISEVNHLQNYINEFQPDIIHSHLFETEIVLSQIILPEKTKRIVHLHDNIKQFLNFNFKTILNKLYLTNYFEKIIVLKNYPKNTSVICISKDVLLNAKNNLPNFITKRLLHNAIDTERFYPVENQQKTNEICVIGSLVDKKGQGLAIETAAILISRGISIQLNIIGDGIDKIVLQSQINRLKLNKNVVLHGNVDFIEKFLQKSKVYLHTAKNEPFGLVLIEAMACGLPVVCSDGKGNRDLIQEGENGFMVLERDPEMLADKIELLLKNDKMRIEMGQKAHAFAQNFGMKKYSDLLVNLYKSI
jgi:glycosyltransferase involved in cell wall biosynthesis